MPPPANGQPDQLVEFLFPIRGVDLYSAFQEQRPGTTIQGKNVRGYEPLTQRARGGARPGLVEYIPQQLPLNYLSGSHKIQHLNVIVDPTPDATSGSADSNDADAVLDPTTNPPGTDETNLNDHRVRIRHPRKIRKGGWGHQPNRNRQSKKQRKFEQQNSVSLVAPFGDESLPSYTAGLAFPANVKANSLLICVLERDGIIDEADPDPTVADTLGNTYILLAKKTAAIFNNLQVYLFYVVNAGGPGACTVNFTVRPGAFTTLENNCQAILEYSGFAPSAPADSFITNAGTGTALDSGSVPVTLPLSPRNEMILGMFGVRAGQAAPVAFTAPTDKIRSNPASQPAQNGPYLIVADHIDVDAAEDAVVSASASVLWQGIGASFKPA